MKIGIVIITTAGANVCTETIVKETTNRGLSHAHPAYATDALPFALYHEAIEAKDWSAVAKLVVSSIHNLVGAGADFIIIPSNTPHYAFQEIQEQSPLPVINLIELTVQSCIERQFKKVAVLGTKLTMQEGLYAKPLEANGIIPVIPSESLQNDINQLIKDQIIPMNISQDAVEVVREQLMKLDCEAYILGCTELPIVFNANNLGKPVIDTTRILAVKSVDYALNLCHINEQRNVCKITL